MGKEISKLQYITTNAVDAEKACMGGADWIQLRVKNVPEDEWRELAIETLKVCRRYGAKLIINDYVQLAKDIGADGVHLGKEDMNPAAARLMLGEPFIIGGTANSKEDMEHLLQLGVDYIGLGPFRFTTTKTNLSKLLGLEGYRSMIDSRAMVRARIPVIAIGGIKLKDVAALLETGVYGIAVSAAITNSGDVGRSASGFIDEISNYEKQEQPGLSTGR
jgi:thiamine-phosphate pyrophosphorylase